MSASVRPCAACGRPALLWRCTPCIFEGRLPAGHVEEPTGVHSPSSMPQFALCGANVGPGGEPMRRLRADITCTGCLARIETLDQRPAVTP